MARFVGVTPQAVQKWLSGGAEPRGKNLTLAAEFLCVSPAQLKFGGVDPIETAVRMAQKDALQAYSMDELEAAPAIVGGQRLIPIVGRVEAGPDGLLHVDDYNFDHPDGYLLWYTTCTEAYALRIRGESMSPRYLPGEFVGVDPCAQVLPSDEVIVLLHDGRRMIKRLLWQRGDQACFESVNKAFQNIILDMSEIGGMHLVLGHVPKSAFRQNTEH